VRINVLDVGLTVYNWPVFRCPSLAGFGCPPRFVKFNLDEFPRYVPLTETFQFLLLMKLENPKAATRLDDGSPIVRVRLTTSCRREDG
jgi:hypothetical protein